jgi:2Fe-2S ferredoxin
MASAHFDMITIYIADRYGLRDELEIPVNLNLSLMEVLRAAGYPVLGTCGGIALCATCAVEVLSGAEKLLPAMDQELDMLDLLPNNTAATRLSCQIRLGAEMDGIVIRMVSQD